MQIQERRKIKILRKRKRNVQEGGDEYGDKDEDGQRNLHRDRNEDEDKQISENED